ncbi:MAG: peptidoglycan-binding protein [Rhizobiaceae bacterium]
MRQAYPGLYNNPAMAAGSEGDRLTNLKRAIDAIEHKLVSAQPTAPSLAPQVYAPPHAQPYAQQGYGLAPASGSEISMMQEQLNRLSGQIANPQPPHTQTNMAADPMVAAAQIAQRQQMLNGNNAPTSQPPAAQPVPAPVAPPAAALPTQNAINNGMELIGQHLNGLKKELSSLKQQVSKPVSVQQSVSQKEIDRIAKAIADLQNEQKSDDAAFEMLSKEMAGMREGMRKDIAQAVRREISTSNGNQANEMSTRFDARLDALTKEIDQFSNKPVSELGERIEVLAKGLDEASLQTANTVTPRVDDLTNQVAGLRVTIDDLPQTLAISRLDDRFNELTVKLDGLSHGLAERTPEVQSVSADDINSIEGRLDEIARALVAVSNSNSTTPAMEIPEIDMSGVDRVEARMGELARAIDEISNQDSSNELQNIATRIDGLTERLGSFEKYAESGDLGGASAMFAAPDIGMVEEQLRALNARIEEAAAQSQTGQLEEQLRQLAVRVEEAANVNSTAAQMSNLEAQIGQIIRHMSKEEAAATVDFSPLEARLGQIEVQIAGTQNFSLEAAQQAAQHAVALMGDQSEPGQIINALSQDLKSLQMAAESGNVQNAQTVENVQQTLHQVVERLMSIEDSITNPPEQARQAPVMMEEQAPSFSAGFAASEVTGQADLAVATHDSEQLGVIHQAAVDAGFAAPSNEDNTPAQVDAPPLSPVDHIEKGLASASEDNALLEPGSAAPDISRMVEEATQQLNETKAGIVGADSIDEPIAPKIDISDSLKDRRPSDDLRPDAVAAARRALQATTAEMNSVKEEAKNSEAGGKSLAGKLGGMKSGFDLAKLRKPLVMGAAALLLAVVAFKGASMFTGKDVKPLATIETPAALNDTVKNETDDTNAITDSDHKIVRNVSEGMEPAAQNATDTATADTNEVPEAKIETVTEDPVDATAAKETITAKAEGADNATPSAEVAKVTTPKVEMVAPAAETQEPVSTEATPVTASIDVPDSAGSAALVAAAASGDTKALFQVGMRYSDGNGVKRNMTEAAKWFDVAAEKGFAPAQYSIGSLYEKGIGVERDITKASNWYEKAAVQGNARAMHNLAVIYAMGNPPAVKPNMDKAVGWFQKAAKLGIKDSQFNLGILYGQGMGVPQNLSDSYLWFALAAKTGDSDAAAKRDEVANAMDPSDLDHARKSVNNWSPDKLTEAVNRVAIPKEWQGKGAPEKNTSASNGLTNVKAAQTLLNKRGFNVGDPDGLMGPKTKRAIMEFQRSAGIPITGKVDTKLLKALNIQT